MAFAPHDDRLPNHAVALLHRAGLVTRPMDYARRKVIISQGSPADSLFFLYRGTAKVSIVSKHGKEAVIGILSSGSFFGEACLAEQKVYASNVEALVTCSVISMKNEAVLSAIHKDPSLAEFLISYTIQRNLRTEEDLAYQLFAPSEKRLAHILVRIAEIGVSNRGGVVLPNISQETLAQMVGTTRSRINFFLNKFRRQGLIDYDNGLRIHPSLTTIVKKQDVS